MYRDDPALEALIADLKRRISDLETQAPVGFTAVSRGALRILSSEGLIVDGTARVDGSLVVVGTERVSGRLEGSGVFDWSGPLFLRGNTGITGVLQVAGNMTTSGTLTVAGAALLNGDVTLNNDLTLGSGRIIAGPIVIDKAGGYGGRVYSGGTLLLDAGSNVVVGTSFQALSGIAALGDITATADIVAGGDVGGFTKSFWIDHPTKPGKQLRHGSLEGPEHGVYYRGIVQFDATGESVFELPEYFTALVIPDDEPTVHVTPIGRPFPYGAERVVDRSATIYGDPGREAHVTVTAARGHFDIEPDKVELNTPVPPE